jgi:hypothetical protein
MNYSRAIRYGFLGGLLLVIVATASIFAHGEDICGHKGQPSCSNLPILELPAVLTQLDNLYAASTMTFLSASDPVEFSFDVLVDGSVTQIESSHAFMKNVLRLPPGTRAIVHTHPKESDPKPSQGDIDTARKANVENYVLSLHALWVAESDGTIRKVADIREFKHRHIIFENLVTLIVGCNHYATSWVSATWRDQVYGSLKVCSV